ncbi:serine hydrolase domain-containing protein [Pseudoalteromonas rubra]|uniref:serine hydrolase domain-containing protein n=1 Tax=Pseudoalteromonas rubra TaxID=43658 RepID=UPI002DB63CA5|nr:serine hydrolase domain-containing protein [Pseudoalteromonas rubra]MEC4090536.1 serine hydrolase domain-containing protein [Pseudoalteromonas rubra]
MDLFKQILADYCDEMLFFGSVYITSGEEVVYEANCGPRDIQSYTQFKQFAQHYHLDEVTSDAKYQVGLNTSDSKYRIGSNTKEFAAALLQQMLSQEVLETTTIGDYLPWFPNNACKDVTLHNLLTMSSGIVDYSGNPKVYLDWGWRPYLGEVSLNLNGPEAFSNLFCTCEQQGGATKFVPGTLFEYSNCNYYLIGNIIEQLKANKQGYISPEYYFGNILEQRILSTLEMDDSGTFNAIGIYEKMTTGYIYKDNQFLPCTTGRLPDTGGPEPYQNIFENPYSNPMVLYSAGNMYSTVKDMHTWDLSLYGDLILDEQQKANAFTPYQKVSDESEDHTADHAFQCEYFGYGWFVNYVPKYDRRKIYCPETFELPGKMKELNKHEKFLSYSGSYPYSWVTSFSRLLDRKQAVMVFSNYNQTGYETDCIAQEIRNVIFYGEQHRSEQCENVLNGNTQRALNDEEFREKVTDKCRVEAEALP